MRAVIDPNVIISGVFSAHGSPADVLQAWRDGKFEAIVSPNLLAELRRALAYPKLRLRITEEDADRLTDWISPAATHAADPAARKRQRSADPNDDYLIALAAGHNAALVSGDRHLLDMKGRIPVYAASEFIQMLEGQDR